MGCPASVAASPAAIAWKLLVALWLAILSSKNCTDLYHNHVFMHRSIFFIIIIHDSTSIFGGEGGASGGLYEKKDR